MAEDAEDPYQEGTGELLAKIGEQWNQSWDELVRRCDSRLRVLLHFKLNEARRRQVDPDDVMQDVWTDAMRCFGRFEYRGPGSFHAWLVGILCNKLRGKGRTPAMHLPATDVNSDGELAGLLAAIAEAQTGVSTRAANRELVTKAKATLEELPEKLREVVLLRIYEGLSGREAARRLGVHDSTVSVRFKQALELCSKRLRGS